MKISVLKMRLFGIHAHNTQTVRIWGVVVCPFCHGDYDYENAIPEVNYLKTRVLQCLVKPHHVGWLKNGVGYMVDLSKGVDMTTDESEQVPVVVHVESDKVKEVIMYEGGYSHEYLSIDTQPDFVTSPSQNPCLEVPLPSMVGASITVQLPLPVNEIMVDLDVKKVYPMPLMNPKSEWGKRMKEKLLENENKS